MRMTASRCSPICRPAGITCRLRTTIGWSRCRRMCWTIALIAVSVLSARVVSAQPPSIDGFSLNMSVEAAKSRCNALGRVCRELHCHCCSSTALPLMATCSLVRRRVREHRVGLRCTPRPWFYPQRRGLLTLSWGHGVQACHTEGGNYA